MLHNIWYKSDKWKDLELWRSGDSGLNSSKTNKEEFLIVQNHNMQYPLGVNRVVDQYQCLSRYFADISASPNSLSGLF